MKDQVVKLSVVHAAVDRIADVIENEIEKLCDESCASKPEEFQKKRRETRALLYSVFMVALMTEGKSMIGYHEPKE